MLIKLWSWKYLTNWKGTQGFLVIISPNNQRNRQRKIQTMNINNLISNSNFFSYSSCIYIFYFKSPWDYLGTEINRSPYIDKSKGSYDIATELKVNLYQLWIVSRS